MSNPMHNPPWPTMPRASLPDLALKGCVDDDPEGSVVRVEKLLRQVVGNVGVAHL